MASAHPAPLIALIGPTGAGKSHLAITLAYRLGGEIVNCDSVQVYRGLDIGSAKVHPAERRGIAHHLIDVVDPAAEMTAGRYARLARQAIGEIAARGQCPIVAGGTGLYLRALIDGLSAAPTRDEALRVRLAALASRRTAALHRFLRRHDPPGAAKIHPNDIQKSIRAVELILLARQPASQTQRAPRDALTGFATLKLGLDPPRPALREKLAARAEHMFNAGLLAETAALLARGVPPTAKALQTLGYKQAVLHLQGGLSLTAAIADCRIKTQQYAKRQMTWFRSEQNAHWLPGFGTDPEIEQRALAMAAQFLNGTRAIS